MGLHVGPLLSERYPRSGIVRHTGSEDGSEQRKEMHGNYVLIPSWREGRMCCAILTSTVITGATLSRGAEQAGREIYFSCVLVQVHQVTLPLTGSHSQEWAEVSRGSLRGLRRTEYGQASCLQSKETLPGAVF